MNVTDRTYPPLTPDAIAGARRLIGVPLRRRPRWTEASKELIIRFGLAIGSRNPLYMSEELASTNLLGTLVTHPTMLHCFDDTLVAPGLPGIHSVYAGADWEFLRPVVLHDRITATARLVDVVDKCGEFCGDMVLQTGEVVYENQNGERVATCAPYVLRTPRDAARKAGAYAAIERYRYTAEDLETIDQAYEAEEIRGDVPRYWEDVQVGDQVPQIVKGPLSSDDMLNFVDIVQGTLTFAGFREHWRRHPQDVCWDPETGMPDSWDASLIKDSVAREFGFPFAHDTGTQRVCWLENMVTNWTGNLGFMSRLNVRLVRPNFIYDTTWCRGRVSSKAVRDGRYHVDLEIWCQNQRGETTATGTASVALVSTDVNVWPPFVRFPTSSPLVGEA